MACECVFVRWDQMIPFVGGNYHCPDCGLRWWIMDDIEIGRDPGRLECDCGSTIILWDGARRYSKVPMFREPTITTAELTSDEGSIPAGSEIRVTQVTNTRLHPPVSTIYRLVYYHGRMRRVKEEDLNASAQR